MQANTETVQTLLEVAFLAAGTGQLSHVQAICAGLEVVRPESEMPAVALATAQMSAGRHLEAVKLLQGAVEKNPESDLAMSFLGLALKMSGLHDASRSVAQQVIDADNNAEAVALAKSLLESRE